MKRAFYFVACVLMCLAVDLSALPAFADMTLPPALRVIDAQAFMNNTALTGVLTIPEGVTTIGPEAFSGCTGLTGLVVSDSVTSIETKSFSGCTGLTGYVLLPEDCYVAEDAFDGCEGVTVVKADEETPVELFVYSIEDDAVTITGFDSSSGLTEVVVPAKINGLPVTIIGESAFEHCEMLESITIPMGVTVIRPYAFSYCTRLTEVSLPDSLFMIHYGAFADCDGLVSLHLPDSIEGLGTLAFIDCSNLSEINYPKEWAVVATYDQHYTSPFYGCEKLTRITIPEGVEYIPAYAFTGLGSLQEVSFPSTLKLIEERAFQDCTKLKSITLPAGATTIFPYAFDGCTSLTEVNLPDGLLEIYWGAFAECESLVSVRLPDSITCLGEHAFSWCTDLSEVNYPKGLTTIAIKGQEYQMTSPFHSCLGLKHITIPEGVTDLPRFALGNAFGLRSVILPSTLETIGPYCFYSNPWLESITIPESVVSIGHSAFGECHENFTIYGVAGSYAETYALENEILFVELEPGSSGDQTDIVRITCPADGTDYVVGSMVMIECAVPSSVQGVRIAVECAGGVQLLTPDENGKFSLTLSTVGSYVLTPYYSNTADDFTTDTATGSGAAVTISAGLPEIRNFRQGSYSSYAYYMDNEAVAPVFTGNVDSGVEVVCEITCTASDANHAVPTGTGEFTNDAGDLSFTYQASALTQEGRYQFTFTPMVGEVAGVPVSFPVYVMTDVEDAVRYNRLRTELLSLPDDNTSGSQLAAGTEMTVKATWGPMAYVTVDGREGFVDLNLLDVTYTPVKPKIVGVVEPEQKYISLGSDYIATVRTQGEITRAVATVEIQNADATPYTFECELQPSEEAGEYVLVIPVEQHYRYAYTIRVTDPQGNVIDHEETFYFCGVSMNSDSQRLYTRWLRLDLMAVDGTRTFMDWENPADYEIYFVGEFYQPDSAADAGNPVLEIRKKDGSSVIRTAVYSREIYEETLTTQSTDEVVRRAIICVMWMDVETLDIYDYVMDSFQEDAAYGNYMNACRIFDAIGVDIQYSVVCSESGASYRNMMAEVVGKQVDYNDETYIYVGAHGSAVDGRVASLWPLGDAGILYYDDVNGIRYTAKENEDEYGESYYHYSRFFYIIDSCYAEYFAGIEEEVCFTTDEKHRIESAKLFATPANEVADYRREKGSFFTQALADYVTTTDDRYITLREVISATTGIYWWPDGLRCSDLTPRYEQEAGVETDGYFFVKE